MTDWATTLRLGDREKKYNLPSGLLSAVMNQESAGNPNAVSKKGARGLFQFMPDTATGYNINPDDPEEAAEGAARMYADLLKQHKGDIDMALAGYNWGSGNMAKHGMENMPTETRNYINSIKAKLPPQAPIGTDSLMGGQGQDELGDPFADIPMDNAPAALPTAPAAAAAPAFGMGDDPFADIPMDGPSAANPVNPNAVPAPPNAGDEQWFEAPAAPAAPARPSQMGFQLGSQGVGRGLADLVGTPVDLATAGLNLGSAGINKVAGTNIPPIMEPFMGGDSIADAFGAAFEGAGGDLIDTDNLTPGDEMAYNVNRFGTNALAMGAGTSRAAAKPIEEIATNLHPMHEAFTGAYKQNPTRAIVNDTAAGVGSGVGVSLADQIAPDSAIGQLIGAMLGGSAGATASGIAHGGVEGGKTAVRNAVNGGNVDRSLPYDPQTKMPVSNRAADSVAEYLQGKAANPVEAKATLADNFDFYTQNDLPMPTTGTMTGDPGAIGVERQLRTADPTPFIQRDQLVRNAQSDQLKKLAPGIDDANKRDAQKFAKETADTEIGNAQATAESARASLDKGKSDMAAAAQAEAQIPAEVTAARGMQGKASAQLDQEITAGALEPRTKAKNEAMDAVDPNREVMRDAKPFIDTARAIKAQVGKMSPESSGLPSEFMSKLEKLAPETVGTDFGSGKPITAKGEVSLGDMLDARKYLNAAAEKAQQAGNFELADNIRTMKKQINAESDRVIEEGGLGSAEAAAAKKAYQEDYAPYFAEGFGRKFRDAIQKDPTGRTALPPSKTADFFLNSADEAAGDLKRITSIAKNPAEAERAVGNYMKAQLANLVKADGTLEPAAMRKWMDNNKSTFEQFPSTKQEMDSLYSDVMNGRTKTNAARQQVDSLAAAMRAAEKDAAATERRINGSVLKTLIDNEPQNAAAKILNDGDPEARMAETIKTLKGNDGAMQAWRQAVADHIESRFTGTRTEATGTEDYAVMQSKVEGFMKKPGVEKAMQALYADQPGAMNALKIAQRIGRDAAKQNIQATAGSATAENAARFNKALVPVELAFKTLLGNLEGGGRMRQLKLILGSIPGISNEAAIQRLLVRAQFEPELALSLYGRDVKKTPARLWTAKINRLLAYGAASRESTDDDSPATAKKAP